MKTFARLVSLCLTLAVLGLLAAPVSAALPQETGMNEMHVMDIANADTVESITDSYGTEHSGNVFRFDARQKGYVLFELKGEYLSFDGFLVASTSTASNASMSFAIFADGVEVFSVTGFTKQMDALAIHLDLTGVNVLEFMSLDAGSVWDSWIYITDGVFSRSENTQEPYTQWATLNDLVVIDSSNYYPSNRLEWDAYGELYADNYGFDARNDAYAMYNLNHGYDTFSGWLFPQRNANQNALIYVFIHVDGVEVYGIDLTKTTEAIYFEIDVRNAKTVKIVTDTADSHWDQSVYIGSSKLTKHTHEPGEWQVDLKAECTADGLKSRYCTVCGELVDQEVLTAPGHFGNEVWEITLEPTCTEEGQQIQMCRYCDEIAVTEGIPALGHTPGGEWEVREDPTCTSSGEQVRYCTVCGGIAETQSVDRIPHDPYDHWDTVREATCTRPGLQLNYCSICGISVGEQEIPVIEHPYGPWRTVSGSAWDPPVVQVRECEACGETDRTEDNSTAWLKPTVIGVCLVLVGGAAALVVLMKKKGLPVSMSSVAGVFKKDSQPDDFYQPENNDEITTPGMTPKN